MNYMQMPVTRNAINQELGKHGFTNAQVDELIKKHPEPLRSGVAQASYTYYVLNQYLEITEHECTDTCPGDEDEDADE